MKKLLLIIFLYAASFIFSQEKNPNVELPDFVILGRDVISVRKVDKQNPDFISTISDEFLKPTFKPDQLNVVDISNPVEGDLTLLDSAEYRKGFIEIKAGQYQLPAGEINYAFPFTRGLIQGSVKALNQTAYVDNGDKQLLEGSLNFNYTLPTDINVIPGTKISLNGKHQKNEFKFFGSMDPTRKRNLNIGHAYVGIQNLYMKEFIFDLNGAADFIYINNEKFDEAIYYGNGFARFNLNDFGIGVKASLQNQKLTTDSLSDYNTNYFFIRPTVSFELFDKIMLEAGFTFSRSGSEKFNSLYASIGAEITKQLVLLAEYSPMGENLTAGNLLCANFYYDQQDLPKMFLKKKNKLIASIKYEFDKYYQIDGGFEYFSSDAFPFYRNSSGEGFFDIDTTDVKRFKFFLHLLYHLGPYGYFYAGFDYYSVKNSESKKIPYLPNIKADLTYGYYFSSSWKGEAKLNYISDRYTDLENTIKLKDIWNIGLKITYTLEEKIGVFFELNNVLNSSRYMWDGYLEKPIDTILGINFFFK